MVLDFKDLELIEKIEAIGNQDPTEGSDAQELAQILTQIHDLIKQYENFDEDQREETIQLITYRILEQYPHAMRFIMEDAEIMKESVNWLNFFMVAVRKSNPELSKKLELHGDYIYKRLEIIGLVHSTEREMTKSVAFEIYTPEDDKEDPKDEDSER